MSTKKVLVIGSGALKIGEAGEFDYSGTQALKALKEEEINTVLINPNIATVQTSADIADKIYFLPITPEYVEQIIIKENPDSILINYGGQTALNCGIKLYKNDIFDKYNIKVLGTSIENIISTEDRQVFAESLRCIGVETPISTSATSISEALEICNNIGYPAMIRSAYTLGGLGSGFVNNKEDLIDLAKKSFNNTNQIIIEECLKGWKEIEYEIVRDSYDNCISVCNMENFDPLGIHTGDSIVVAPSQTLNNKEYFLLREIAFKIVRYFKIIGECNVQFALNPNTSEYKVIELNARLSRSSALASKATGYPLAYVAAKLSLGQNLINLKNPITKTTSLFFEPSLDYIVVKIPKWDLDKFDDISKKIGSSMKSVGEVMAIGKTFEEAMQKGLRMVDTSINGFVCSNIETKVNDLYDILSNPTDKRIFAIEKSFEYGITIDHICKLTNIDKWFISRLYNIFKIKEELEEISSIDFLKPETILRAKKNGFSDYQIAKAMYNKSHHTTMLFADLIRSKRKNNGITPFVKQIDTLAAEYPAQTNYCYLTYHGDEHDCTILSDKSVLTIGSGPYKIGSSVEFDWCCVETVNSLKRDGIPTIIINCNPETVSTDYDTCDRLYFEELTLERILDISDFENQYGTIVSMGGQIPNNLALQLYHNGIKILGTSPYSIDMAENRRYFSDLCDKLNISQPKWTNLKNKDSINYPIIIRPSYVLSGSGMEVLENETSLNLYLEKNKHLNENNYIITEFISDAKEIEVDAISQNGTLILCAISEHIEHAGVHSGDSTIIFPYQNIDRPIINKIKNITRKLSKKLNISGPLNIQLMVKDGIVQVIECNLRASRSMPFVSKISKINMIDKAVHATFGKLEEKEITNCFDLNYIGVKSPQFSFNRVIGVDPLPSVNMMSTGEVACIGDNTNEALLKSMLSVGYTMDKSKKIIFTISNNKSVKEMYFELKKNNFITFTSNILDRIENIGLIIDIPDINKIENYHIRDHAIKNNIPLITNLQLAEFFVYALCSTNIELLKIKPYDEY